MKLKDFKAWSFTSLALALVMVIVAGLQIRAGDLSDFEVLGAWHTFWSGTVLAVIAGLVFCLRARASAFMEEAGAKGERQLKFLSKSPLLSLFFLSCAILFIEVMFIRYCSSQVRIFAFYKNIPLIACFLGLGLGCFLRGAQVRHLLLFFFWMVPLVLFLSQGSLLVEGFVSNIAAVASSEFILGDDLIVSRDAVSTFVAQFSMGGIAVLTLYIIATVFSFLGRMLGSAFEQVPRLSGYSADILGSLTGILCFVLLSYLHTPPWLWFAVGLVPLLFFLGRGRDTLVAAALIAMSVLAVLPSRGDTIWSSYQKLVGHETSDGYYLQISDVYFQMARDLSPEANAQRGFNPVPRYDAIYDQVDRNDSVLIVGAGMGNDVAAALRNGAKHVDAVEIDAAIVGLGRSDHPEHPYADSRVRIIVDDARSAFGKLPARSYDVVVFGALDSHTQLGISSVRLDNYVFTLESFAAARRLLKPGGSIVISAVTPLAWMPKRFSAMLETVCGQPVRTNNDTISAVTYVCQPVSNIADLNAAIEAAPGDLPTDDWPFLYLPERAIPQAYVVVVGLLLIASIRLLVGGGLGISNLTPFNAHMFFLGAGFLLMEVYAINRLALLFGTTWLVSAITIGLVLVMILCANLTTAFMRGDRRPIAYCALASALTIGFFIDPHSVLGRGDLAVYAYSLLVVLPVYFAGLVFAQSFQGALAAGPAIGANILGAMLGGWMEYATMVTGIRSMAVIALALYGCSVVAYVLMKKQGLKTACVESRA